MRTSNKILLGGFLIAMLTITGIHVAIYAKIKSGDLVAVNRNPVKNTQRFNVGNINQVVVKSMWECHIWPSDTAAIEVPNNWQKYFRYRIEGDTLFVEAASTDKSYAKGEKSYAHVNLFLPAVESINTFDSRVFMNGEIDSSASPSRKLKLFSTEFWFAGNINQAPASYWDSVNISNSVGSSIGFWQGAHIKNFEALLSGNTSLDDQGANFGSLVIKADTTSSANLRANSLSKLKFIKL